METTLTEDQLERLKVEINSRIFRYECLLTDYGFGHPQAPRLTEYNLNVCRRIFRMFEEINSYFVNTRKEFEKFTETLQFDPTKVRDAKYLKSVKAYESYKESSKIYTELIDKIERDIKETENEIREYDTHIANLRQELSSIDLEDVEVDIKVQNILARGRLATSLRKSRKERIVTLKSNIKMIEDDLEYKKLRDVIAKISSPEEVLADLKRSYEILRDYMIDNILELDCEKCKGDGKIKVYSHRNQICSWELVQCDECQGNGSYMFYTSWMCRSCQGIGCRNCLQGALYNSEHEYV